jgi:hypothetical protein
LSLCALIDQYLAAIEADRQSEGTKLALGRAVPLSDTDQGGVVFDQAGSA